MDTTGGFNSLHCYTYLAEQESGICDSIIALCSASDNNDEIVIVMYDKMHYVLVDHQHINTISIEIKTDQHKHISFCFG